MTPLQRVLCTMAHQEPDLVPVFLLPTMHGARELGVPLAEFFARPDLIVEGQVRLQQKLGHDCYYALRYGAVEAEAFGSGVLFTDDGPPNAGAPVAHSREEILALSPPDPAASPALQRSLEVVAGLAERAAGRIPVLGVMVAPASLPIMLLGFERYLVMLHEDPQAVAHLLAVTGHFSAAWGKAQIAAGATALAVADPMASSDVSSQDLFERWVLPETRRLVASLGAPVALSLASGRIGGRLDDLVATGATAVAVSTHDDLADLKRRAAGRITLIGNLNGIAMTTWTQGQARACVKKTLDVGAPGGGFILADNHGEIPLQVPLDTMRAVVEEARAWTAPQAPTAQ